MLNHLNEKMISPVRVVILGARGFIGRALVEALRQEKNVVVQSGPGAIVMYANFTTDDPRLRDPRVCVWCSGCSTLSFAMIG